MTIKQFSLLCGCNPQTLRYYDHVGLLKPATVDQWSGYRYYEEEQAYAFVKIRNLQKAGFTIAEIRELLEREPSAIYQAFEAKIAEQEQRLQEIKRIRESYQTEMSEIQEKIRKAKDMVLAALRSYHPEEEFGIDDEQYAEMFGMVDRFFEEKLPEDPSRLDIKESDSNKYRMLLGHPDYEIVYEDHGWDYAKRFLEACPALKDGGEYVLVVTVTKEKEAGRMAFANVLLGILLAMNPNKRKSLACSVERSEDGLNHFWMLEKKPG